MKRIIFMPVMFAIALALSACAARTSYVDLYGQAAPASGADHTIVITSATKYVNVEGGQTVKFVAGGNEFAWTFNVARTVNSFDLNEVAPPGVLNHVVRVYVSPDPKYIDAPAGPDDQVNFSGPALRSISEESQHIARTSRSRVSPSRYASGAQSGEG
jgi:hypothetical protein